MRKAEFEKFIKTASVLNIGANNKGHIYKHMHSLWTSDEALIERIIKEGVSGATVFDITVEEIDSYIKAALLDYEDELLDWITDDSDGDNYVASITAKKPIGHGYFKKSWHEWNAGPCKCSDLIVVLKKVERKYDTWVKIVTVYAVPNKQDVENKK